MHRSTNTDTSTETDERHADASRQTQTDMPNRPDRDVRIIHADTDRQLTDTQTYPYMETDKWADRQADRVTDIHTGRHTIIFSYKQADWLPPVIQIDKI